MKKILPKLATLVAMLFLLNSCATIFSKSVYPLSINTSPSGAKVILRDRHGADLYVGTTPASLKVKSSYNFFQKAKYTVVFEKEGYETISIPVTCSIDGWYYTNLFTVYFAIIPMLIIDPATGAMWKLDQSYIYQSLPKVQAETIPELKIMELNDVPDDLKPHLVQIDMEDQQ